MYLQLTNLLLRYCILCSLFWQRYQASGSVNKHYNVTSNRFSRQAHTQIEIHIQDEISSQLYITSILSSDIKYSTQQENLST